MEYSKRAIERALFNWQELDMATDMRLVDIRCDIEMAVAKLRGEDRVVANTMMLEGEGALTCGAVELTELNSVVGKLHNTLEIDGLFPYWDAGARERELARFRKQRTEWFQ